MDSSMPSYGNAVASGAPRTIADAVNTADQVHSHLLDTAATAERLANMLGGPLPEVTSDSQKSNRDDGCMADHLNLRVDALRDPAIRISSALARISQRLG